MKHSALFQPTKMMHEMFTMREKPSGKIGVHKLTIFDIVDFITVFIVATGKVSLSFFCDINLEDMSIFYNGNSNFAHCTQVTEDT